MSLIRGCCKTPGGTGSSPSAVALERDPPVCDERFCNCLIQENGVTDGILVGDKGFPSSAIEGTLSRNIRLHFLNPIKRNARFIETHGMLKFEGKLTGYYKSACEFDDTRVHNDDSVIGSEFCDFLSTVLTWRLIKAFTKAKLLDDLTYKRIMKNLVRAKKAKVGDGEWQLVKVNPSVEKMLAALGLDPLTDTGVQENNNE